MTNTEFLSHHTRHIAVLMLIFFGTMVMILCLVLCAIIVHNWAVREATVALGTGMALCRSMVYG
jgi:hypothetical protein